MAHKVSDSEKRNNAIEYLKKIGFLINYNDLELYHGRVKCQGEEDWFVKSNIDNSHKTTRDNIMGVPCLCVASYDIAEAYARGTSLEGRSGKSEIHEIVALDNASLIVDEGFKLGKLSENELRKFYNAIYALSKGVLKKYVANIDNSDDILNEIQQCYGVKYMLSVQDEAVIFDNLCKKGVSVSEKTIEKIVGAINSNDWFNSMPIMAVSDYVFALDKQRKTFPSGGYIYSQNMDIIRAIFDTNKIIALKKKNSISSSLSNNIVYVFNLNKVQTIEKIENQEK